ncbi:MAG: ABC transporter ATP-binding protein [Gammaproteobacteria bacterium]|jgi:ABC-2 type transport system ATP-binding protein|nr:ABC transporter ATP-binding protein [Gammaproteobacteria bacterium]|tara:strand:- start:903 stop:1787 length:885 start_codon:yes stop_codon:yes gene_type:complete
MAVLEISQLTKNYQTFSLGPIDLALDAGCAMGLIGANGAGKTTLFRCLMGTVRRDHATITIDGKSAIHTQGLWKQQIGYVGDYTPLFGGWSGKRNLATIAPFYPDWSQERAEQLAGRLNLDLNQKVKHYSTGQRAKLAIILALSHSPKLLLMDEPTSGLDPVSREVFMELLFEQMASERVALLYATHHISEIEQLADRLVFISNGRIVRDEIKEDLAETWRRVSYQHDQPLADIPNVMSHKSDPPYHELISDNAEITMRFLSDSGVGGIESSRLSIEKIAVQILRETAEETHHV